MTTFAYPDRTRPVPTVEIQNDDLVLLRLNGITLLQLDAEGIQRYGLTPEERDALPGIQFDAGGSVALNEIILEPTPAESWDWLVAADTPGVMILDDTGRYWYPEGQGWLPTTLSDHLRTHDPRTRVFIAVQYDGEGNARSLERPMEPLRYSHIDAVTALYGTHT